MEPIKIASRRELFWDDYLIETATAKLKQHKPQVKNAVMMHDSPWEGCGCIYHVTFRDGDIIRMYYLAADITNKDGTEISKRPPVICYAESRDGKSFTKPNIGICEFEGSKDNNIILDNTTMKFDNFAVFKDSNPGCKPDEIYKAVALDDDDKYLWCFTSLDAIHFNKAWRMTNEGTFDSLNIAFWDRHTQQYYLYLRDLHGYVGENKWDGGGIRDIRWSVSKDFVNWSTPVLLDFGNNTDIPLYTNVINPYYRADHMFIGFPSRYIDKGWTRNFESMPDVHHRKNRMNHQPRFGTAITDCILITSRDGKSWRRWNEAFLTPGLEHMHNWVYGDCYPSLGLIETENDLPYAPEELSFYTFDYHWKLSSPLRRYTIRIDGFISYNATYKPCTIVTKLFIFKGKNLSINFTTSAIGYIKIKITGESKTINSIEIFGDSLDRTVIFEDGDAASLAGKPVKMEIIMSDADIYSFKFNE
ncbi:MAG: hypothetical protein FIA99_10005 [Ruminiclostridium sp.]|nr:hypothetical protein [Ruminiclostridium sp.]